MVRRVQHSEAGFTLIELLVVLVIMGIILSFATLSMHRDDPLAQEVDRFIALSDLAGQEAVLKSTSIGMVFSANEYSFVTPQDAQWQPHAGDAQFRPRTLPEGCRVQVYIDGLSVSLEQSEDEIKPQLVFLSSGERTPVEVVFNSADGRTAYRIVLNEIGRPELHIEGQE